ncbi:hypothetical protein N7474_002479 [Penicillium riverlandense]|uniref:uncharacterized protein n=1 Tax=Penicillium riverlandense TaxID=1903569 RepID=UPI0025471993|nr:uncharacterized protein N7474_002479 [Penicillium riverlandense]KAJ5825341.1 hypothetical protein N7474_002479 [Penicillium riverlandense]
MSQHSQKHKVAVIGSGNWGSTVGKILAENVKENNHLFETIVPMWVFEEDVDVGDDPGLRGKLGGNPVKLSHAINTVHQNIKYLPGVKLPDNLIANPDLQDTVKDASILVFNLPHQFLSRTLDQIKGHYKPYARGISCIKGVDVADGTVTLYSEMVMEKLQIYCGALSGANIAPEVAAENFCETTIGYDSPPMDYKDRDGSPRDNLVKVDEQRQSDSKPTHIKLSPIPKEYPPVDSSLLETLFQRPYFQVHVVKDAAGVALGGALKNIIALAAGFVAGKGWGENTKAAIIRIGVLEMVEFGRTWFPKSVDERTFTEESAGMADLIASCNAGRNYRSALRSVEKGVPIEKIEQTELGGQKLQGISTAQAVHEFLSKEGGLDKFPLFASVYGE